MPAAIPPLLADLGAGAAALTAVVGLFLLVGGLIARAARRAEQAFHDKTMEIIEIGVPAAIEKALPQVTREAIREEVDRALEPHAAQLRAELRQVRAEMKPNGGSSFSDQLNARIDSLERGQRKIFAHLDTTGSLDVAEDPDDTSGET